jgi:hypothetical protein
MKGIKSNNIVIAYGFEFNKIIINDNKCCIGKSIYNKNPVYCSLMITDTELSIIKNKINLMKIHYSEYLSHIDNLAKSNNATPKWQIIKYDKDFEYYIHILQGKKFNYDSELYPCC